MQGKEEDAQTTLLVVRHLVDGKYQNKLPLPPVPKLLKAIPGFEGLAFGLQLPQLITNDVFTERQRFTTGRNAAEKKIFRDPPGFKSKEELAQKIGKTFQAAKEAPVHPSKPHLRPKRVMQVVPDVQLWSNKYVQVAFDEQPRGQEVQQNDLLLRSAPDPRTTCFSQCPSNADGERNGSVKYLHPADAYDFQQQYYWSNRGGFQQADELGEGKAQTTGFAVPARAFSDPPDLTVVLAVPRISSDNGEEPAQQAKFIIAPTRMILNKLKAHRLDIEEDTKALRVTVRQPPDLSASALDSAQLDSAQLDSAQLDSAEPVNSAEPVEPVEPE
ncbi:unnamed protein product [Symbiodinium natans]|uniref:Uncharacterized protein n=1 Tax=Symbiodinium natans TaxID=878477 RepID=A0A812U1I4_9DINO|nr:unnamed protein product [Symbiodinium natans]